TPEHAFTRALGGQQSARLSQLRRAKDEYVQRQHLKASRGASVAHDDERDERPVSVASDGATSRTQTIEAVLESRAFEKAHGASTASRLREKIRVARGGSQTERLSSTRDVSTAPHEPLLPAFDPPQPQPQRPSTDGAVNNNAATSQRNGRAMGGGTQRRIAAVRRQAAALGETSTLKRRMTKEETEWIEKQQQFAQRSALLEKDCESWWTGFYASAMATSSEDTSQLIASIHRQNEELALRRVKDIRAMHQQLRHMRGSVHEITDKVHQMQNGHHYYAELQDMMQAFEEALATFREAQRAKFDADVAEEKGLDMELQKFMGRVEKWEQEALQPRCTKLKRALNSAKLAAKMSVKGGQSGKRLLGVVDAAMATDETSMMDHVRSLNDKIAHAGGQRGGWDEKEHAQFVTLLTKCQLTDEVLLQHHPITSSNTVALATNNQLQAEQLDYEGLMSRFLRKCAKKIVTRTPTAVRNHIEWYVDYLQLVAEKKQVIQAWKDKKNGEREVLLRQGLARDIADSMNGNQRDEGSNNGGGKLDDNLRERTSPARISPERVARERSKKVIQLQKWREEKERREQEKLLEHRELERQKEAEEAKQEHLDKKQKILLYKLRKEEEQASIAKSRKLRQAPMPAESAMSPGTKDDLVERSRKAIEQAKAKRAKLDELEAQKLKQQELPERPQSVRKPSSEAASPASRSPIEATLLLRPTKAFEARATTQRDLYKREKQRQRQSAHDAYIPGVSALADVKVKSFGHLPIQPRAVPAWRRNI
ncbi:TPA: hypothetical protein N0F65_012451, partial [Lagenidium giganteum]